MNVLQKNVARGVAVALAGFALAATAEAYEAHQYVYKSRNHTRYEYHHAPHWSWRSLGVADDDPYFSYHPYFSPVPVYGPAITFFFSSHPHYFHHLDASRERNTPAELTAGR